MVAVAERILTERETEIAALLSHGSGNKRIARRLGIRPKTVEAHVANLYRKLGINSRGAVHHRCEDLGINLPEPD